jgi:hypothetical protein|tara:strand:+ start:1183 stop:1548 length:366 start_codon:yes stop_codon:yes gene_type:complete
MNVTDKTVVESRAYPFLQFLDLWIKEFNYFAAANTDKVIVMRTVEPVFVAPFTVTYIHARNKTVLIEKIHGAIDRGAGDFDISFAQRKIYLFRLTMFIRIADFFENFQALRSKLKVLIPEN